MDFVWIMLGGILAVWFIAPGCLGKDIAKTVKAFREEMDKPE